MDESLIGACRDDRPHRSRPRLDLRTHNSMATPLTTSTTQALTSHLAQVFAQYPIEVAHGDGVWLHARDGRKILDFYGGAAVAGLGVRSPRRVGAPRPPAPPKVFHTHTLSQGSRRA